jgi:hypothetical protein
MVLHFESIEAKRSFSPYKKIASLQFDLARAPANPAAYRGHGQDA